MTAGLRPYQIRAIESCRTVLRGGKKRIVIASPTGSGKTVLAESIIKGAINRGKRVAFIVNRVGLLNQTSRRFTAAGIPHGILQSSNTHSLHQPCLICSIQTVARRRLPEDIDFIVIDESHACAGSVDYRKLIFSLNNLPILGLTATPFSKGLAKEYPELGGAPLFEALVVAATIRELIDMGFLVDVDIYAPSEPDLSNVKSVRNSYGELDYSEMDLAEAVDKPGLIGDIVTHWKQRANGKPTICFATNIAHSKHIVEEFQKAGVNAIHIDCYLPDEEKAQIWADVLAGKYTVVSNVALLGEGLDYPALEVMINARPTRSLIRWIQTTGRILRPFPGKARGIILDHSGSAHRLGYPTDDLPLELDDGTARKSGASKEDEREPDKPKKCPSCSFMKPAGIHQCPRCGFKPERPNTVETEEGELRLVDRTKKSELSMANKQEIYSQLLSVKSAKGYSDGWASNQYREIFGVWPKGLERVCTEPTQPVKDWLKYKLIQFVNSKHKGERRAA